MPCLLTFGRVVLQAAIRVYAGYVDGVGCCDSAYQRWNLTDDPYLTDGKRAVILLSTTRATPHFVAWC